MKLLALFSDVLLLADQTGEIEFLHINNDPMVCDNLPSLNVGSFNEIVGGLLNYDKPVICAPSSKKCFYITENGIKQKAHIYWNSKTMQIQQKVFPKFGKTFHIYLMKGS